MIFTPIFVYVYIGYIFECIYLGIVFRNEHVFCFDHTIMYIQKKKKKVRKKNYLTKRKLQKHKSIPKYPWEIGGQTTPSLPRNV